MIDLDTFWDIKEQRDQLLEALTALLDGIKDCSGSCDYHNHNFCHGIHDTDFEEEHAVIVKAQTAVERAAIDKESIKA